MAKTMSCRDVGPDCDFKATGETEDEVLQQVGAHAASAHGITDISPEMLEKVKGAIKEE